MTYRLLICGGRYYGRVKVPNNAKDAERAAQQRAFLPVWLDKLVQVRGVPSFVLSGGAKGADLLAEAWRRERGFVGRVEQADWDRLGRKAGRVRNKLMLDVLRAVRDAPKLVVAFPNRDARGLPSIGTANMMEIARAAGIEVLEADRIVL